MSQFHRRPATHAAAALFVSAAGSCPAMTRPATEHVVMTADQLRRTLVRIAHEIVEKNPDAASARRRRHPHPRRGPRRRLHALAERAAGPRSRSGDLDISFYRDDVAAAQQGVIPKTPNPVVKTPTCTSTSTAPPSCSSTTSSSPAAPCGRRSTRSSTTAARRASSSRCWSTAATASCRSGPTTWARTCRRRARERVYVRLEELDGVDEVVIGVAERSAE